MVAAADVVEAVLQLQHLADVTLAATVVVVAEAELATAEFADC